LRNSLYTHYYKGAENSNLPWQKTINILKSEVFIYLFSYLLLLLLLFCEEIFSFHAEIFGRFFWGKHV
jgi:hypothetical protein